MYLMLYDNGPDGDPYSKTFDSVEDIQAWLEGRGPYTIVDAPPILYEGVWESRYENDHENFGVYITKVETIRP